MISSKNDSMYQRIYATVKKIPPGKVSTYGRIAKIAGGCSARNVGYAMAALPFDSDVPWHRVINAKGEISLRKNGEGDLIQKQILEAEGIVFNEKGKINLGRNGWHYLQEE